METEAKSDGPSIPYVPRPSRAGRPDGQFIDEIRIVTVPRWKESELSGDEWRISARVEFYRKGQLLGERSSRDVETAARFLDWYVTHFREDGEITEAKIDDLCDQEGCSAPATVTYRLKKRYCNQGHASEPYGIEFRRFCERHRMRGDCGLEDSDTNYEPFQ